MSIEIQWPVNSDEEIWMEYGWVTSGTDNMLWYNEGNSEEFHIWYRALMTKMRTNEPKGEMYFTMGAHDGHGKPRKDIRIVLGT